MSIKRMRVSDKSGDMLPEGTGGEVTIKFYNGTSKVSFDLSDAELRGVIPAEMAPTGRTASQAAAAAHVRTNGSGDERHNALLRLLSESTEGITAREAAEQLGTNRETARRELQELVKQGAAKAAGQRQGRGQPATVFAKA